MANQSWGDSPSDYQDGEGSTEEDSSFVKKLPDGNLLSQILNFSDRDVGDSRQVAELEKRLLPVAAQFQGEQRLNEAILKELVSALLPEIREMKAPLSTKMVEWIARTLFADPLARGRLEGLWVQLIGRCVDDNK